MVLRIKGARFRGLIEQKLIDGVLNAVAKQAAATWASEEIASQFATTEQLSADKRVMACSTSLTTTLALTRASSSDDSKEK
jgi:hypothetical protein